MIDGDYDDNLLGEEDSFDLQQLSSKKYQKVTQDDEGMDTGLDSKFLTSMGINAKHIQTMKASFFGDGDFEGIDSGLDSKFMAPSAGFVGKNIKPIKTSVRASVLDNDDDMEGFYDKSSTKELLMRPQTFHQPPIMEHKLLHSGLQSKDSLPRIVGTLVRHNILHVKDSILYRNQHSFVDAACFMGRSFRVGWGPSWKVVHSGSLLAVPEYDEQESSILPSRGRSKTHPSLKSWMAHIERINVTEYMDLKDAKVLEQQEELLKIQLDNSRGSIEDGCPVFVPEPGVEALHKLADYIKDNLGEMSSHPDLKVQEHMKMVLRLCVALWGKLPDSGDLDEEDIYLEQQLRREALSEWLSEVGEPKVSSELEAATGSLFAVYSKLTIRKISEACESAQKGRDHYLALLLSQAIGSIATRQMVGLQLANWAEIDAYQFIDELRLKVYCLLAGQLVWHTSCFRKNTEGKDEVWGRKELEINSCHGLDWKRAFALHLWFKAPANSSIQHALRQYQQGFQGSEHSQSYCAAPLPPYLEEEEGGADTKEIIYDTAYHLLCLYADSSYQLEALLSPTSSTPSHLDFRLSWHLLQILQALQYKHLSPHHTDTIHVSYAAQLETLGLWHWAVFVLLHISDGYQRRQATLNMLQRHLEMGEDWTDKEQFLIDKLSIPTSWLHQAKAIRAKHEGNYDAEARHWLLAGYYNTGHSVVIRHIAADAIINDKDDYLKCYLDEMAPPERSMGILNWANNGKVFLDFINLRKRLDELKRSQPTPYDLEQLQPDVLSLCTRVKGLTCHNAKDRLCQAEMAKTSANLLRTFLVLCGESPVRLLSKFIPELPMPEDYTLQELQALTRAHLLEIV
ncbi:unnamed protein product [Lymnaea stagnalis]|uniref:Nuclear pore complex protein NUP96 C-terminal domain-containing protein n=1 Tax=Lymnaea stagnalis TaxID=6523 RepID=A0AAV2HAQ1_LYMST